MVKDVGDGKHAQTMVKSFVIEIDIKAAIAFEGSFDKSKYVSALVYINKLTITELILVLN